MVAMLNPRPTYRLNPALILRLRMEAKQRGITLSALVRDVLEEYFADATKNGKPARLSPRLS